MTFEIRHPDFIQVTPERWEYSRDGQLRGVVDRWHDRRGGNLFHRATVLYRGAWWDAGSNPDVTVAVMTIVAITASPDEAEWVLSPAQPQLPWDSWEAIAQRQSARRRK